MNDRPTTPTPEGQRITVDLTSACLGSGVVTLPFRASQLFVPGVYTAYAPAENETFDLHFSPPHRLGGFGDFFERTSLRANDALILEIGDDGLIVTSQQRTYRRYPTPEAEKKAAEARARGDEPAPPAVPAPQPEPRSGPVVHRIETTSFQPPPPVTRTPPVPTRPEPVLGRREEEPLDDPSYPSDHGEPLSRRFASVRDFVKGQLAHFLPKGTAGDASSRPAEPPSTHRPTSYPAPHDLPTVRERRVPDPSRPPTSAPRPERSDADRRLLEIVLEHLRHPATGTIVQVLDIAEDLGLPEEHVALALETLSRTAQSDVTRIREGTYRVRQVTRAE